MAITSGSSSASSEENQQPDIRVGMATFAAIGASLVGLGLARYAYAPLQPALVAAGWFTKGGAALLAAANLGGYFFGALFGARLARRVSSTVLLRLAMLITALSFLACADRAMPFVWFFAWRAASGFTGGLIMVVATTTVLAHVEPAERGFVSQMSLFGLSLGVVCAGAVMPLVLHRGLTVAWIGLGVLALLLTAATWSIWPPHTPHRPPRPHHHHRHEHESGGVNLYYVQYGLAAFAFMPHMVFLVDYIARDLGRGLTVGSHFYLVFAAGSVIGPFLLGYLSSRIGVRPTLRTGLPILGLAVLLPLLSTSALSLAVSCFLAGLCMPGLVATFLARSQELAGGDLHRHRVIWGRATATIAVWQAVDAFVMAYLISRTAAAYEVLFVVAVVSAVLAFGLDFVPVGRRTSTAGKFPPAS